MQVKHALTEIVLYANKLLNLVRCFGFDFHQYYRFNKKHSTLRTDTGGLASICIFCSYSGTIVARILYHILYLRFYFSLSNDVVIRMFRQKMFKMEI